MKSGSKFKILGVRIDNLTRPEIIDRVRFFLSENNFHQIATINPEFILKARENSQFKNILNNCDLNVADGFGIKLAGFRYGKNLKARIAGIDLMLDILKIASFKNLKIFLVTNNRGLSTWEETRDAILKIYPNLVIGGANLICHSRFRRNDNAIDKYDILFCNFGAPEQEIFINWVESDTIRLAMGVGGSFDFLTGKIKRAPIYLRKLGLEWLWRLIQQPHRWKRIINVTLIFPWKILWNKF